MSNASMPNLVKVGFTRGDPNERARQLFTTGVPCEFKVEFAKKVSDCELREKQVHEMLSKYHARPFENREFFECSPKEVFEFFELLDGSYLHKHNAGLCDLRNYMYVPSIQQPKPQPEPIGKSLEPVLEWLSIVCNEERTSYEPRRLLKEWLDSYNSWASSRGHPKQSQSSFRVCLEKYGDIGIRVTNSHNVAYMTFIRPTFLKHMTPDS